ncbi:MAG: hypothetical protein ACYCVD_18260 [Desulfitobacteriaceae bacterium]
MKKAILILLIVLSLISITGCTTENTNNKSEEVNFTYEQYQKLISLAKDGLIFKTVPMKLSQSYFSNPTIIIVDKNMSFGKKNYLTLNNKQIDPTQNFLTYEDKENDYKLIIGWIYTNINQGNNLLYFKPYIKGESTDFNDILSYKNLLIHVQLTSSSENPNPENFGYENAMILTEIVSFLSNQKGV